METIHLELRKLGLKEKEVSVYLAALTLGYTSVQKIAKEAKISRPTAYVVIKTLIRKGLIRQEKRRGVKRGKKNCFTAESPDKLLGLLRVQKREVEEREREFIRIISALRAKYYWAGHNEIRAFEGPEEIKVLFDDFSQSQTEEIRVLANDQTALKPWQEKYPAIKKRLGGIDLKEEVDKNFSGTLVIYDKLVYLPSAGKQAFLIANQEIVAMVKNLLKVTLTN